MSEIKSRLKLIIIALGIIITYSSMAVVNEKLFKSDYNGEIFNFAVAYSTVQCITPTIFAKALMMITNHPKNDTPQKYYILVSIFHLLGGVTSKMALEYISYPVHVIGKACTPIPVMICGVLIARKSHTFQRYIFVLMVVSGIALFLFKDKGNTKKEHDLEYLGNILIGISLLTDGFKGAAQDVMRKVARPTPLNFMFYENAWSLLMLLTMLVLGEGYEFIQFAMRHKVVWIYIGLVMLCATIGQFFISAMVSHFGSLPLVITTTLRKFFTVLFSVFFFRHSLTIRQWVATAVIFSALLLDVLYGKKQCCKRKPIEGAAYETDDLNNKSKPVHLKFNKIDVEP